MILTVVSVLPCRYFTYKPFTTIPRNGKLGEKLREVFDIDHEDVHPPNRELMWGQRQDTGGAENTLIPERRLGRKSSVIRKISNFQENLKTRRRSSVDRRKKSLINSIFQKKRQGSKYELEMGTKRQSFAKSETPNPLYTTDKPPANPVPYV